MIIFLNGDLLPAEQAAVSPSDRGFTLGDGLFETIKARNGQPLRLSAHWRRLSAGADILRLTLPLDEAALATAIARVLAANALSDAALRLTVSRGPGVRGLLPPAPCRPTMLLTAGPLPPAPGPASAVVAQSVRRNQHSPLARCKTLSYLDNVLARLEAEDKGTDEAVLLNTEGLVAETTIANLFIVAADGAVLTPPVTDGALPGVCRAEVLQALAARERSLSLGDVWTAREVFLTNALSIRPLTSLDGRPIGDGRPGAVTLNLRKTMDE